MGAGRSVFFWKRETLESLKTKGTGSKDTCRFSLTVEANADSLTFVSKTLIRKAKTMNELLKAAKADMKRARTDCYMMIHGTKRGTVSIDYNSATKRYTVATIGLDTVDLITDGTAAATAAVIADLYVVLVEYEIGDLPTIGPISITETGGENMYFTLADGGKGFVKIG